MTRTVYSTSTQIDIENQNRCNAYTCTCSAISAGCSCLVCGSEKTQFYCAWSICLLPRFILGLLLGLLVGIIEGLFLLFWLGTGYCCGKCTPEGSLWENISYKAVWKRVKKIQERRTRRRNGRTEHYWHTISSTVVGYNASDSNPITTCRELICVACCVGATGDSRDVRPVLFCPCCHYDEDMMALQPPSEDDNEGQWSLTRQESFRVSDLQRKLCYACNTQKQRTDFSNTQWHKTSDRRCRLCIDRNIWTCNNEVTLTPSAPMAAPSYPELTRPSPQQPVQYGQKYTTEPPPPQYYNSSATTNPLPSSSQQPSPSTNPWPMQGNTKDMTPSQQPAASSNPWPIQGNTKDLPLPRGAPLS